MNISHQAIVLVLQAGGGAVGYSENIHVPITRVHLKIDLNHANDNASFATDVSSQWRYLTS